MANGARRTTLACAALLGSALLTASSAQATHTVSVRVFVGPLAPLEGPGGSFSRYGFDVRLHAEVRGAPACESWSLSVSGADIVPVTAQGGAQQELAGRGTVTPGSFAELVGSASCTANGHRADASSETTYAVAPPKPVPETPSSPSRLLDGEATGELRRLATRSTGLALLACSKRSARRSRRLKPLLDPLCGHGALAAFASPLVGGTSGSGSPVALAPRVGAPAARALKRLCRQRRGRACRRLVRSAGAYLEASSRSTELTAALGATAVRFADAQESQGGLWAHAAAGRVYAGWLSAALAEERVRARALARALRRARVSVQLGRAGVAKATRRFARLRLLPRALGRAGVRPSRLQARSLLGLQHALGPAQLDLRKLLVTGGGSDRLQAYARTMTPPMVLGLAEAVLSESSLPFDAPARVALDRELGRLALLCEPAERAAALTGAVTAAGALPGRYAAHLAAAAAAVPPIAPPARPPGCPEPLPPPAGLRLQFGGFGTGPGQLDRPTDVAVGPGGVYVADQLNSRIQRFTPDGRYLGQWGGRPLGDLAPGPGQFLLPVGVAQAADGSVYVSDFGAHRVQQFTADGAFVREWGGKGANDGQFDGMTGLTVDRDGFVYVADARNGRVQKFTADGAFVLKFGTPGTGPGQFNAPRGITTDAAGDVYVADRDNGRVQVYSPTGTLLREWGRRGTSPGRFNGLYDVAIDGAGNVWTADLHNFRLQRFTPTGTLLGVENRFGSTAEDFDPWAVAVDAAGRIYAADILGGTGDRILVFGF